MGSDETSEVSGNVRHTDTLYPFVRALGVLEALPRPRPDSEPLVDSLPHAWPTVGDLRRLVAGRAGPAITRDDIEEAASSLFISEGGLEATTMILRDRDGTEWTLSREEVAGLLCHHLEVNKGDSEPAEDAAFLASLGFTEDTPGEWSRRVKGSLYVVVSDDDGLLLVCDGAEVEWEVRHNPTRGDVRRLVDMLGCVASDAEPLRRNRRDALDADHLLGRALNAMKAARLELAQTGDAAKAIDILGAGIHEASDDTTPGCQTTPSDS
jgi:hypothetical protein